MVLLLVVVNTSTQKKQKNECRNLYAENLIYRNQEILVIPIQTRYLYFTFLLSFDLLFNAFFLRSTYFKT
jgi:hypothetical protein